MKKCKYENITIKQAERMIGTGYITELICDADNKEIYIPEEECLAIQEKMQEVIKPVIDALTEAFETICKVVQPIINAVWNLAKKIPNKKISKKRFIKLLQSQGIQRREINKIIQNNKEPYTYLRYYNTTSKLLKDE